MDVLITLISKLYLCMYQIIKLHKYVQLLHVHES
jgi:hypothetical protein